MKEVIKKLHELALDYVKYGIGVNLPDKHNTLTDEHKHEKTDIRINVYFSDGGRTWSVELGNVEVKGYSGKITFPINSTAESLKETYTKAKGYLDYLMKDVIKVKSSVLKAKAEKIEMLRKEIEKLRKF